MWTRLIYVTLMTVCLITLIRTEDIIDPSSEDIDDEDDPTTDDSEDGEGFVNQTTPEIDIDTSPGLLTDPNHEADIEDKITTTSTSISKFTKELKDEENPEIDVSCGDPPSSLHAKIGKGKKLRYSEGDVVHYSCDFGYVTDAFEWTSKCFLSVETNILEWTPPQINCIPRSCGDPGYVDNGHRIGSLFTFPNRVSFECDEGYQLRGNGIRFCKTSGTWSGTLPTCERIFCNHPLKLENGKVSFTSLEFGSELAYECHKGFVLKNLHQRVVCSENGTWSGEPPICQEGHCEPPVAPDHGTVQVVGGKSNVGSRAIYTCDEGRFMVGSPTSTCLDMGKWTFPTPKCLESCAVPKVPHGKIRKYERGYRNWRYKELSEGTYIEDGTELVLSCEGKYEPFGSGKNEEKIYCNRGEWGRYPRCDPATCKSPPPRTPNARVRENSFSRSHGKVVVYDCNAHFRKSKTGNVTCQFGTWIGKVPICEDTRCDVQSLDSLGIELTFQRRYYKSQDVLILQCKTGYTSLKPNNRIKCLNGKWDGLNYLPCTPANCSDEPPEIKNGEIANFGIHHTSEVIYKCNEFFTLKDSDSKVQCQFGQWIGTKPTCQETRCYVENLKNRETILADTERITYNGDTLQVRCADGFSSTGNNPKCVNGEWEEHQALCKENDCNVYNLDHGKFTQPAETEKCNSWGFNCRTIHGFEEVRRNQNFPAGSSLYVSCDNGYTHHGTQYNSVKTKCSRGQWKPSPVCLKRGTHYYEEASTPNSQIPTMRKSTVKPTSSTTQQPAPDVSKRQQEIPSRPSAAEDTHKVVGGRSFNCSCKYQTSDGMLVAFAGLEKLNSGTLVKDGCKIRFHCSPVGYYHLNGPREITCKNCHTWHSSEYPQCVKPRPEDTIFEFQGNTSELAGGAVGVILGSNVRVICISRIINDYPRWTSFPRSEKTKYYYEIYNTQGKSFPSQVLELSNISPDQNGIYECSIEEYRPRFITITVKTPEISCPKFSKNDYFSVHYDSGQSLNSSAVFSCKDPKQKVDGPNILTCLSNGQWSGDPPQCRSVCPELQETEGLTITYNDDRRTDSSAIFNCDLPRIISGVTKTVCKRNGEWADLPPICEMPSCQLEDLYSVVPEYVIPNIDDFEGGAAVPYDFSLSLLCDENRILVGTSDKAKCKHGGRWEIENIQCVIGCLPVKKHPDSEILIDPEEDSYRIGQFVTFSCARGKKLSMELERIMCLPRGWSQTVVPSCVDDTTEGHASDEGTVPTETEGLSPAEEK